LKIKKRKILIHLGYPKTGSTSIQNFVKNIENKNLSKFILQQENTKSQNDFIKINKEIFFEEKADLKKWISYFDLNLKKFNILSDETFLYPTNYIYVDFNRTLKRYLEIFEYLNCEIHFLICVRDPKDLHISYFNSMYHRILQYDCRIDNFKKYIFNMDNNQTINHIFRTFNFNHILKTIQTLRGPFSLTTNLKIIKLENLNEFKIYFFNFCEDLNLNEKYSNLEFRKLNTSKIKNNTYYRNYDVISFLFKYKLQNKLNYKIFKMLNYSKILNFFMSFKKIESFYSEKMIKKVNNYYKNDLKQLGIKTNLDFKHYYD